MNKTHTLSHVPPTQPRSTLGGPRLPLWTRWLVAAVGMLASTLAAGILILPLAVSGAAEWVAAEHSGLQALAQALVVTVIYGAPTAAAWALLWGLGRLDRLRLRAYLGKAGGGALRFLGYGAAVALTTTGVSLTMGALGADAGRSPAEFSSSSTWLVVLVLTVSAVLMQGIPEELWFRGMAWVSAGRRPWTTLVGTTLIFTLLHLGSSGGQESLAERVVYLALPLGMGFLAGCARWCTDSVWAAAGTHSGLHVGMIPAHLLALPAGPWMWIILGVLQLAAGAVLLLVHRPWRHGRP